MRCDDARDTLIDLLYDELEGDARAATEAHLEHCEACRAEWRALAGTRHLMGTLPQETPARGDAFVLQAAAREVRRRERRGGESAWVRAGRWLRGHPLAGAGALAAVVLLLVVGVVDPAREAERLVGEPIQMASPEAS